MESDKLATELLSFAEAIHYRDLPVQTALINAYAKIRCARINQCRRPGTTGE
jgi:hypothetical protein